MIGELKINGKDAFSTWGMVVESGAISELMTPPANKPFLENKSTVEHGKRVYVAKGGAKVDERSFQLPMAINANSEEQFYQRYALLCEELRKGLLLIETKYQPNVVYKCTYDGCQNYNVFNGKMAKFILKLNEPNPMDRSYDNNL